MTKLRFLARVALALALSFSAIAGARADRLFFSESNVVSSVPGDEFSQTIASPALAPMTIPDITMNVGDTKTLYVWFQPSSATPMTYNSVAWDIDSSNGAAAHVTNQSVLNGENLLTGGLRWSTTNLGAVGAPGSMDWITNANGFVVGSAVSIGVPTANPNHPLRNDPHRDLTTNSYMLGSITFTADQAGSTGLYFRNGSLKIVPAGDPPPVAQIQYGNGTDSYPGNAVDPAPRGDPITGDLALADAIIRVQGIGPTGPTIAVTPHDGTNTTGDVVFNNSPAGTFIDVGGRTSGRINFVNYAGQNDGSLPLFFDLVPGANAAQLVADLNAIAGRPFTAAATTNFGADIVLTFPNQPAGADLFIDFDFGTTGVARIGIPEPSTVTLAGIGLVGLVGYGIRRRRKIGA